MALNAALSGLGGEHRTEPVPPELDRLVANLDAALEQYVLYLAQWLRVPDVHRYREADNLR